VDIRVECVIPDGLSGKKRVWFRGIFHLIGILGERPFVSKLRKAESAQHSVHRTAGTLCVFGAGSELWQSPVSELVSPQPPVTHTVHGSNNLLQTLLKNDLVDECRLWIFPVVLGGGKRLFGDGVLSAGWKLVDSKTSTTGVVIATYTRAGEIQKGSAALETPTEAELARRKKMREEG